MVDPPEAPGRSDEPRRRRHRGIQYVGVGVSVLFLGALVLVLLSNGRVQGSIPGSDSILSLAAIHRGFLVGTAGGVLESPDGKTWLAATNIPREPVFVASDGTTSFVLAGGTLKSTRDLRIFGTLATGVTGTVIAPGLDGTLYVAAGRSIDRVASPGGTPLPPLPAAPAPGVFSMAVVGDRPDSVLVGAIGGLWRTDDAGRTWQRILGTPSQAVLVDPSNPQRILLGTPGGVLVSGNGGLQWRQTEMRKDVHGLSQENGKFFAVTTERVVYGSNDGTTGWTALTP
ncbi:MAG: hypothetical protein E6G66_02480 [Actinobacteria bacterium]|nr:MAG: hypothetical protein E6G66_02480 [Actinomycetota bacterium]